MILPGLINAHDHLEFNLFPRLGNGPYPNATAWAKDIFHPQHSPVKEQLAIPKTLRLLWGGMKNLLSGVTTVAHHNSYHAIFNEPCFPVRVLKRYGWAHSIQFSPDWLARFRETPGRNPFIIHACEGTDESARQELGVLTDAGALQDATVLVHGVALDGVDAAQLVERRTALVWCPSSNRFTLGRTIHADVFESCVSIALATDSGMTGAGDLFDELQEAASIIEAERLYEMVTSAAARILRLPLGFGEIRDGSPADFLVLADNGQTPAEALLTELPHAVIIAGQLRLASLQFAAICRWPAIRTLQPVEVEGRGSYLTAFDTRALIEETKAVFEGDLRLAGKAIEA
ncbi:MAG TPA: amidohydrolase family protein [Bryobacteraceae bacterium]|nr:amidohydrolase family protein [Bryobacteraceae bacterium]